MMNSSDLAQRRARLTPEQRRRLAQRLAATSAPVRHRIGHSSQRILGARAALLRAAASLVFMAAGAIEHGVSPERRIAFGGQAGY